MINHGANLRDCIKEADRLGVRHENVHRTGERRFFFPDGSIVKVNERRKDSPRSLTHPLRRLAEERNARPGGIETVQIKPKHGGPAISEAEKQKVIERASARRLEQKNGTTSQEVAVSNGKHHAKVTRSDAMRFAGWAFVNAKGIEDGSITYDDIRAWLTSLPGDHAKGYANLSNGSVRALCKDAGVTPAAGGGLSKRTNRGGRGHGRPSITDEVIIEAVTALYSQLGIALPDRFLEMLDRMSKDKEVDK